MDLPEELQEVRKHLEQYKTGTREFAHILSYIPTEGLESVVAACKEVIASKNSYGYYSQYFTCAGLELNQSGIVEDTPITILESLKLSSPVQVDCSLYNSLLKVGGKQ